MKLPFNTNPDFPQLFRDIFKNAYLPYRDPETLKLFIKTINEFSYDHSEKLGDAFEYLLSIMGSQGDAGQFRTPRNIIDFVVEILQPKKHETMLNPACGTAGFLISAYKHILKTNTSLNNAKEGNLLTPDERIQLTKNIRGYDISPDMVRLSLVNLYLHGFTNPEIYEYDSLTTEDRWNEYYDVILANPPFMTPKGGIKPHKRFSIQSNRAEVLFVDFIAEHLTPTGRAGIIVPEGIVFQSGTAYKSLRKMLIDKYLWAVVSLPAGIFNPYSGVKTSILLLDKTLSKKTDNVLFVKVQEDGFGLGAQRRANDKNDLPTALNLLKKYQTSLKEQQATPFGDAVHDDMALVISKAKIIENGDYNFSGDRYKVSDDLRVSSYEMVKLGDIAERITKGTTPTTSGFNYQNYGINFVKIESINDSGSFIPEKFAFISEECYQSFKRSQLKENDILFSIAGALGRIAIVKKEILPANTNQALAIISLKEGIYPKFIFWILKGGKVLEAIENLKVGVAQLNLSLTQISEFKIPLPALAIQQQIVAEIEGYQQVIDGAKQVIKAYKPHISIKKHWEMVELGEVANLKNGFAFKSEDSVNNGTQLVKMGNVKKQYFDFNNSPSYLPNSFKEKYEKFIISKGDILISMTGTVGKTDYGYVCKIHIDKPFLLNQRVGKFEIYSDKMNSNFLYLVLIQDFFREQIFLKSAGGVRQANISGKEIEKINIPLPSISEQKEIVSAIEKEQQLVNVNKELVAIMEAKIKAKIAEVWGEEKEVKSVKKEAIYHIADEPLAMVAEV